jgi:predicted ATPase
MNFCLFQLLIKYNLIRLIKDKLKVFDSYVNKIKHMIDFYRIHHLFNQNLPILFIHGPNGCGKSRIVEGVSSKLNMHLCQVK